MPKEKTKSLKSHNIHQKLCEKISQKFSQKKSVHVK